MLPITPREWKMVGISSDMDAFRLMKYLYGFNQPTFIEEPYENCMHTLAPSTLTHIAEKFLQLAATNNTDGGHHNPFRVLETSFHLQKIHVFSEYHFSYSPKPKMECRIETAFEFYTNKVGGNFFVGPILTAQNWGKPTNIRISDPKYNILYSKYIFWEDIFILVEY